jgi:hypothetical protein
MSLAKLLALRIHAGMVVSYDQVMACILLCELHFAECIGGDLLALAVLGFAVAVSRSRC